MNKQKFTKIVKEYHSISADDRNKLHELVQSYPYSQAIHTLVAKANMDASTDIAKQTLAYAAMYSADRSVLKEIIASRQTSDDHKPSKEESAAVVEKKVEVEKPEVKTKKPTVDLAPKINKITIDPEILKSGEPTLSDTIMKDLNDLKESKASYLEWLNLPDEENDEPSTKKAPASRSTKTSKTTKSKTAAKAKPAAKTAKKEKAVKPKASPKAKSATKKTTSKPKATKSTSKSGSKAAQKKSSSKEEESKRPDQSKIIEKFIAQEPSITAKASRKSPENQEDLSIASTSFNEDLVSENLAKILISQGKSDKAIDIYKKLIWKFPQKKAYFASQIEELKNNK